MAATSSTVRDRPQPKWMGMTTVMAKTLMSVLGPKDRETEPHSDAQDECESIGLSLHQLGQPAVE